MAKEIVSLQLGHYANFVGAHWWNIQDSTFVYNKPQGLTSVNEINNDIMFREGLTLTGEVTYTPRLIAFDLLGSLNTLKQEGVLYDLPGETDINWTGEVTLHKEPPAEKNEFLKNLDGEQATRDVDEDYDNDDLEIETTPATSQNSHLLEVDVWSDFLRLHLHPRSIHIIDEYKHNDEFASFHVYGQGRQLLANRNKLEDIEDKLHFFLEECDHLQGLHLMIDTFDGFGGLGVSLLEQLRDDYGGKSMFIFAASPSSFNDTSTKMNRTRILNSTLSWVNLSNLSSAFLPLCLSHNQFPSPSQHRSYPGLKYEPELNYHTSAIIAAALDTMSLPYRLESGMLYDIGDVTRAMTSHGRRILSLQSSFPFPSPPGKSLIESLMDFGDCLPWQPLSPSATNTNQFSQSIVLRGIAQDKLNNPHSFNLPGKLRACTSAKEILEQYFTDLCPGVASNTSVIDQACHISSPYPPMFINESLNHTVTKSPSVRQPSQLPVMTSLQCTADTGTLLSELHSHASKINLKLHHKFLETGLEEDEIKENLCVLQSLADAYSEGNDALI